MPVFVKTLLFFFFFLKNAFVQFSRVFNEKVLLCIRESATFEMKEAIKKFIWFFRFVSTHLSHGGICPFGEPSILSPAKLIQLSIQCFWSINEDSLCSVLYYCTLATHMQFALDNSRFYAVASENQRWLCSGRGHTVAHFLFFRFVFFTLTFLLISSRTFFFIYIFLRNLSLRPSFA